MTTGSGRPGAPGVMCGSGVYGQAGEAETHINICMRVLAVCWQGTIGKDAQCNHDVTCCAARGCGVGSRATSCRHIPQVTSF
jgi:hypothetical protein